MPIGPSTTASPYLVGSAPNIGLTSLLTAGDPLPGGGAFAGFADGLSAFDNGDGSITVLVVHMLGASVGLVRDHGATGSYIDRLVIDKQTLAVTFADDLIKSVMRWNDSKDTHYLAAGQALAKLTVSDLAEPTAYFNSATGLGTDVRLILTGSENGTEARAYVTSLTGLDAGTAWELPYLGNMNFQTIIANPFEQDRTVLAITDDTAGGQIYFYLGQKQATGSDLAKAGLMNGDLFGLKVTGLVNEIGGAPASGTFTLQEIGPGGDVSNMTGAQIEAESDLEGVTGFLNPEDAVWDPVNPNILYFTTTGSSSSSSRLYKATFDDIKRPELGGTIEALLVGTEGQLKLDSIEFSDGKLILQEDPGNSSRLAAVWEYDIATDTLVKLAQFDPARFISGQPDFITQNEEASGILEVTHLLGDSDTRAYLLTAQVHRATNDPATVQMGQLLLMHVDQTRTLTFDGGIDTYVRQARPTTSYATATTLQVDGDAGLAFQTLLAFTDLFGDGPGQIPVGATITSAILALNTTNSSGPGASLYRMTADWTSSSTWSSLGDGIQIGTETHSAADLVAASVRLGAGSFDVTASLNAWLSGATSSDEANLANKGWVFIANGTDGWDFSSFEGSTGPVLTVTYLLPPDENGATVSGTPSASIESGAGDARDGMGFRHWNPHADWFDRGFAAFHSWDSL